MDINVHVNLTAPEIVHALLALVTSAVQPKPSELAVTPAVPTMPTVPAPVPAITPAPLPYTPPAAPAPVPVPVATPPAYMLEALAGAAAPLVQAGKQTELIALLGQFGVQAMGQLKPEQYGAFATALRQMGGKI